MNLDNYPIETRTASPRSVAQPGESPHRWHCQDYYWRGVSLDHRYRRLFEDWLSCELAVAATSYPHAPFPLATRNFQRNGNAEPVRWNHANICFFQAQARKIQKFWRELPTEVAVPCAEAVEQ